MKRTSRKNTRTRAAQTPQGTAGKKARRRRRRTTRRMRRIEIIRFFVVTALIAAALLFFWFFFRIREVEVTGNSRYSDEEIAAWALQSLPDRNSLFLSRIRRRLLTEDVPYVDSIDAEYVSHNRVRLLVSEDFPIGFIRQDGYDYYFDIDGMVLASKLSDENNDVLHIPSADNDVGVRIVAEPGKQTYRPALSEVPRVAGLTAQKAVVGSRIPVLDTGIFETIQAAAHLIEKLDIMPDCLELDETYHMTLYYGTTRIRLGSESALEEKMIRAAAILPQLEGMTGVLHLENYSFGMTSVIFDRDRGAVPAEDRSEETVSDMGQTTYQNKLGAAYDENGSSEPANRVFTDGKLRPGSAYGES